MFCKAKKSLLKVHVDKKNMFCTRKYRKIKTEQNSIAKRQNHVTFLTIVTSFIFSCLLYFRVLTISISANESTS